jgi:conjugative transfer region lipoprotein (TIGR03751 family)
MMNTTRFNSSTDASLNAPTKLSRAMQKFKLVFLLSLFTLALACVLGGLMTGCTTTASAMFPTDKGHTMMDVWNAEAGSDRKLLDARSELRRPLSSTSDIESAYTQTEDNAITSRFKRLPNPDLSMYIFPHLAGTDQVPVPGYTTIFPFYTRVEYAMPGERVANY